jgi:hypothetical protein
MVTRDLIDRRSFLAQVKGGVATAALASMLPSSTAAEEESVELKLPKGKADRCIFIWLGGGAAHIDTWDPKRKGDGKKQAGSYYDAVDTAIPGAQVCQHLSRMAPLLDRAVLVRTVNHDVIDEHAAAVNRLHTGRVTSGTVVYPSIGSIVSHELGAGAEGVPAYVVMGYPNVTRGPGFLGAKHSYLYLTETDTGPNGLTRPNDISSARQERREALLARLRDNYLAGRHGERSIEDYAAAGVAGLKLSGPQFMSVFDLKHEAAELRESYGGEFGQRCLLARRLVASGVRFVEVASNLNFINGTGWDTHNQGQLKQHELIDELDRAMSTLIVDLERHKLLDRTLIVVATEFGRPPEFDAGGGRGHHCKAFSCVLAGGGLKTGQAIGETDELGRLPVSRPISVPDLHATIHWALGIDPAKELYAAERPVPITDGGKPLRELFS